MEYAAKANQYEGYVQKKSRGGVMISKFFLDVRRGLRSLKIGSEYHDLVQIEIAGGDHPPVVLTAYLANEIVVADAGPDR